MWVRRELCDVLKNPGSQDRDMDPHSLCQLSTDLCIVIEVTVPSPAIHSILEVQVVHLDAVHSGVGVMVARILKPDPAEAAAGSEGAEPQFQTPKERECWQLYRRMLEKGVSVSYDTILRCATVCVLLP